MKKHFALLSFIATFTIAMVAWSGLAQAQFTADAQQPRSQTQQQPGQQPTGQAQPAPDEDRQTDANDSKEFIGTVLKQGDKYVFQDSANGTTYDIDHQEEVKKFEGKKVRVHGTLDPNGKMIHVQ